MLSAGLHAGCRTAGGPAVLDGNVAAIGDPLGGVIGVIHRKPGQNARVQP